MKLKTYLEFVNKISINELGDLKNIVSYDFNLVKDLGNRALYKFELPEDDGSIDTFRVELNAVWYQDEIDDSNDYTTWLKEQFPELYSLYDVAFGSNFLGFSGVKGKGGTDYIYKILKTVVEVLKHYMSSRRNTTKIGFCFSGAGGDIRRLNFYKSILETQIKLNKMNLKLKVIQYPGEYDHIVFY